MDFSLQNKINRRLKQLKRDNIKFIAPTIAPADSSLEEGSLESIKQALDYYAGHGVDALEVQLKWMGSRGNIYLFADDVTKSFLVTRSGFVIRYGSDRLKDNEKCFKHWHKKMFNKNFPAGEFMSSIILDAEIMPWSAVGRGLINKKFVAFSEAVHTELDFLDEYGFYEAEKAKLSSPEYLEYIGMDEKDKKAHKMRESFSNIFETLEDALDAETRKKDIEAYDRSLSNFTREDIPTTFAVFDILRIEYQDGSVNVDDGFMGNVRTKTFVLNERQEDYVNDILDNGTLGPDTMSLRAALRPIFNPMKEGTLESIQKIMKGVSLNGLEGIVLKPVTPSSTEAVPAMKVRDPEYLRIIYGPSYMSEDLEHLIKTKRTGRKRKLSHHEHKLANQMLKLDDKSETYNADYERIAKALLFEIEEESTVDGRL